MKNILRLPDEEIQNPGMPQEDHLSKLFWEYAVEFNQIFETSQKKKIEKIDKNIDLSRYIVLYIVRHFTRLHLKKNHKGNKKYSLANCIYLFIYLFIFHAKSRK